MKDYFKHNHKDEISKSELPGGSLDPNAVEGIPFDRPVDKKEYEELAERFDASGVPYRRSNDSAFKR